MSWTITETNQTDERAVDRLGSAFLLGNGSIGYRGTLEEDAKDQRVAAIVSGLYDKVGELWREPVNMPNPCQVRVFHHGALLHARVAPLESHRQTLDLRHATHERETTFLTEDGNAITVRALRFVSLAALPLVCVRYTVEARRACTLQIEAAIDADVWDLNGPHLRGFGASTADGILSVTARTAERGVQIAVSQLVQAAPPPGTLRTEAARASRPFEAVVTADAPFTLTLYAALCHGEDALARSRALCAEAARSGFPKLLAEHGAQWEERWERCGVTIQGDAEADDALRFSMYHLLSVAPVHGHDASIPARGLSGQMYKGAIFWDTEIFMLPFFSFAFPEIARTLLLYRHRTLDGARRKAQEYGYRGAFFAWESQDTGDDACTLFNVTDVFTNRPLRTYFRDKQVHISADIVYAFWRYIAVTGDEGILLDGGAEVIYECCRFLLSTLYYSREKGRYEMLDVTGPDEYHERVHNNCYTNWMTGYAFDVCLRIAGALHASAPDRARELLQRLSFEEDLRAIEEVSTRLYRPGPRGHARVVPQFDGYLALRDVPVTELLARKLHPHEYLGGGNGLAVPTQVIKQADVVLGLALLPDELAREDRRASWEYYEPRTEHGSSLSACAYALVAAEIGRGDEAYRYFMKAATIDRDGASKSHVGTLYIGGTHPASNGGAWMAAIMGLCGVRVAERTLVVEPRLPERWTAVTLPLTVHGWHLRLTVGHHQVRIEGERASEEELCVQIEGKMYPLGRQAYLTVPLSDYARRSFSQNIAPGSGLAQ